MNDFELETCVPKCNEYIDEGNFKAIEPNNECDATKIEKRW